MNKQRRQDVKSVIRIIKNAISTLENIKEDEEDYFDNMPENLQYSMRGQDSEEFIDDMEDALEALNKSVECLEEIH